MTPRGRRPRRVDVLVIGGGQAGLAMGRELQRAGRDALILDGAMRVGDSWRARWDSLRLFTPARFDALPGLPFPAPPDHLPTKDEVADYLDAYARAFSLPLALDEPVRDLRPLGPHHFRVTTDHAHYRARHVVVATGAFQTPRIPAVAHTLAPGIVQLHSSAYRAPSQLPPGPVVVVGAGNSGVQIAAELAGDRAVTLATGTPSVSLPPRILGRSLFAWLEDSGAMRVTADSPLGRRFRRTELLIGASPQDLARTQGVRVVQRVVRAEGGALRTSDGALLTPAAVIWATGYRPSYPWLHAPVFDPDGRPRHIRGITEVPGLAFLGLPWQHTRGSSLLGWVARDAAHLARAIATR